MTYRVEKLTRHHPIDAFDCGNEALNDFVAVWALVNQQANASQTYVGLDDDVVVGYYTLAVGSVELDDAPTRVVQGLARHPVPIMLLARLAVSLAWQGRGVGAGLLKDVMKRTLQAADIAGIRALAVHAKDDAAQAFYSHFHFVPSPTDPLHLFMLIKDIRRAVEGQN